MRPIEEACSWLAQLPRREARPLRAPAEHDVVVIGGGLTGLWTALFVKELDPARDVAAVEQGQAPGVMLRLLERMGIGFSS